MRSQLVDQFAAAIDRLVFGDATGKLAELRRPEMREMVQLASHLNQELVPAEADPEFRSRLRAHLVTVPLERAPGPVDGLLERLRRPPVALPAMTRGRWMALGAAAAVAVVAVGVAAARQRAGLPAELE